MYQTLGPLLETYDVLICPTNALPAVPAEFDQTRDTVEINGREVNPSLGWVMTTPFNMMFIEFVKRDEARIPELRAAIRRQNRILVSAIGV